MFNWNLHGLFQCLNLDNMYDIEFPQRWYCYVLDAFKNSVLQKRSKRQKLPVFYSSHTVHLVNKRDTNQQKLTKRWSLDLSIKHIQLCAELSHSIDLDKQLFVDQFNLHDASQCFNLLRSFVFSASLPPIMHRGIVSYCNDLEKANAFNEFFASVFNPKVESSLPSQNIDPHIILGEVSLSVSSIENMLWKCDDSNSLGAEGIPSFLLHQGANLLAPAVHDLFLWILSNKHSSIFGKFPMSPLCTKLDRPTRFQITGRSVFYLNCLSF